MKQTGFCTMNLAAVIETIKRHKEFLLLPAQAKQSTFEEPQEASSKTRL